MNKRLTFRGFCFEADKGAGSGDAPATPPADNATPPAGAQNTDTSGADKTVPIERFNEINNKLKKLEEDATKQAKAQQAADEKRLADEKQWQELADQRQTRIAELEPAHSALTERVTKLETLLADGLEAEIKEWPAEVKALDPGKDADLLSRLEWVNKSRALAAKLAATPAVPGNGRGPRMSGQPNSGQSKRVEPIYDTRKGF